MVPSGSNACAMLLQGLTADRVIELVDKVVAAQFTFEFGSLASFRVSLSRNEA